MAFMPSSPPRLEPTQLFADTPDTSGAGARFRKASSISYLHSGFRDSRERNAHKQRPLVIVIPPTILLHQHGPLGHTLSSGSPQKLAQGIIMSLQSSMYAQLMAISREFNFPSTAGICLYLRHTENGISITPRISDESWSSLWSSCFEGISSLNLTVPIIGTIEFDIDLRQAKWYTSWLSSSARDAFDGQPSAYQPTVASDRNGDSRTFVCDEHIDDYRDTYIHHPTSSASLRRHIPKKLSLVDRFDLVNAKPSLPSSSPSPEKVPITIQGLSPIPQESEPRTAKHDLNSRVRSWRTAAVVEPTPLALTGQSSLEPANIPNTVQIDTPPSLDLEEYTWSISSAGPGDFDSVSGDSEYPPSVPIQDRMIGSVCCTPSTCTSFGPLDYGFDPNLHEVEYLLTPDLAHRAVESAPLTPMTATTWGALLLSPASPWNGSYAASVGVGDRLVLSPPLSASTATSWGPPLLDPPSPMAISVPATPDIGRRVLDDLVIVEPWPYSWPYYSLDLQTEITPCVVSDPLKALGGYHRYPYISIYSPIYPFLNLYPGLVADKLDQCPVLTKRCIHSPTISVVLNEYPSFNLYPPVYPSLDIYPTILQTFPASNFYERDGVPGAQSCPASNQYEYPRFNLYPSTLELHDASQTQPPEKESLTVNQVSYPVFDLYPAVYPHFNIYPSTEHLKPPSSSSLSEIGSTAIMNSLGNYPILTIYPVVYPHFNIYPPLPQAIAEVQNLEVIEHLESRLKPEYPTIDIYVPVYPYLEIYPSMLSSGKTSGTMTSIAVVGSQDSVPDAINVRLKPAYPTISIYAAVYPHFEMYPTLPLHDEPSINVGSAAVVYLNPACAGIVDVQLKPEYPKIVIYPSVYPYLDVYPILPLGDRSPGAIPYSDPRISGLSRRVDIKRKAEYPAIDIYPAVYPHLDIYPSMPSLGGSVVADAACVDSRISLVPKTGNQYPTIVIYPAVYPHFDLYPSPPSLPNLSATTQYPSFDLYPAISVFSQPLSDTSHPRPRPRKTHAQLLEHVLEEMSLKRRMKNSHRELHDIVFPDGIVSTPSGSMRLSEGLLPTTSSTKVRQIQAKLTAQNHPSPWDELKSRMAERALQRTQVNFAVLQKTS